MYRLSADLISKLSSLEQKKLGKGELFLLSKAISDTIPLAPVDTDNIALHTLNFRNLVNEVIYTLNEYTYLDKEQTDVVYKTINDLCLWRFNIAYNPPSIFFKGDPNTVVDDISCILRYVNLTDICAVGDIAEKANWTACVFSEVVKEVNTSINHRNSEGD